MGRGEEEPELRALLASGDLEGFPRHAKKCVLCSEDKEHTSGFPSEDEEQPLDCL